MASGASTTTVAGGGGATTPTSSPPVGADQHVGGAVRPPPLDPPYDNIDGDDGDDEDVTEMEEMNWSTPVPLSREEASSAEVRKLARALAPSLVAAEELFQVPSDFHSSNDGDNNDGRNGEMMDEEDDDLDYEVGALGESEDLLRRELEMANEFGSLFGFMTPKSLHDEYDDDDDVFWGRQQKQQQEEEEEEEEDSSYAEEENDDENALNNKNKSSDGPDDGVQSLSHTNPTDPPEAPSMAPQQQKKKQSPPPRPKMEADVDDVDREEALDRYINPHDLPPIRIPPSPLSTPNAVLSPMTPPPRRDHDGHPGNVAAVSMFATPSSVTKRLDNIAGPPIHYTVLHHAAVLYMDRPVNGWYRIQPCRQFHHQDMRKPISPDLQEFCLSVPDSKLRQWFAGFPTRSTSSTSKAAQQISPDSSPANSRPADLKNNNAPPPVAVRTVTIRIRPDVLCGAVMEAVCAVLVNELSADIVKRQGGHVMATVPAALYLEKENNNLLDDAVAMPPPQPLRYPGYRVEARLATSKGDAARYLVLRAFHHNNDNDKNDSTNNTTATTNTRIHPSAGTTTALLTEPIDMQPAVHLREASALIQRMEIKGETSKRIHWNSGGNHLSAQGIQDVVSAHLLDFHRPCPSVQDGAVTLPALNTADFLIIQSSWRMVETIWDEVESRGLNFDNLQRVPFGAFPSLRTLDVHYCSQIRIVTREAMTQDLLQSARDLEKFARESELACANMINLLQPTYEAYGMVPPSLPRPKPLTEYPLDFVLPQEACPPWGDQVQSALDEIQSWAANDKTVDDHKTSPTGRQDGSSAMDVANAAVRLVMEAFERQDDLEQSARLGRKNIQVMDRLAKMEAHEKLSIQTIQHCAAQSNKALAEANSFRQKSKGQLQEVPLLKWSVLVGNSTGTGTVTASHILFSTQLIPVLGGITNKVFSLKDIEFTIADKAARATSSTILSPLPETITIERDGKPIFSFRPSMGSARLKSFLDVVKSVFRMSGAES